MCVRVRHTEKKERLIAHSLPFAASLSGGAQIIDLMMLVIDITKGIQTQTAECLVIGEVTCSKLVRTRCPYAPESNVGHVCGTLCGSACRTMCGTMQRSICEGICGAMCENMCVGACVRPHKISKRGSTKDVCETKKFSTRRCM